MGERRGAVGLRQGKVPSDLLAALVAGPTGPEVRLGPAIGEDAAVIDVPAGALVAATDPITLTGDALGRFAVIVNANDVAVTGARPRWFLAAVLVPPETSAEVVREVFSGIHAALDAVGAVLVGGHTEVTSAVARPIVVGQMLGLRTDGRVVTTGGARPGDVLVQAGPAPIEGAAVLADRAARSGVPSELLAPARGALDAPGISVVEAALLAADLGATSLHDPTEGGLAGGLHEIAEAAGVALVVDREAVLWFEPGLAVCEAVGADPWATLASGALLATFPLDRAGPAVAALVASGHPARQIGVVEAGTGVRDGAGTPVRRPDRDEAARLAD